MIKISHLDHLVLTVKDIDKTVDFYTKVLGMEKEIEEVNHFLYFLEGFNGVNKFYHDETKF